MEPTANMSRRLTETSTINIILIAEQGKGGLCNSLQKANKRHQLSTSASHNPAGIIRQQPTQWQGSHAEQSGKECRTSQPPPWMKLRATWLDPLHFVVPHSKGNSRITCYSCTAASNWSLSLILDTDLSFPTLTFLSWALGLAWKVSIKQLRHTK